MRRAKGLDADISVVESPFVAKLEPRLEPVFHTDSYGYRLDEARWGIARDAARRWGVPIEPRSRPLKWRLKPEYQNKR
jgi:hypothetical protein